MRRVLLLLLALLAKPAWAQRETPAGAEAPLPPAPVPHTRAWIGTRIRLETFVTKTWRIPKRPHVVLKLNGPGKSPSEPPFVAFVRGERLRRITGQPTALGARNWLRGLVGKRVRVEGDVTACNGQPQIVVTRREQLEVLN